MADRTRHITTLRTGALSALTAAALLAAPVANAASAPSEPAAAPGELLVKFSSRADAGDRRRLREEADTDFERKLPLKGLQLLKVERGQSVRHAVAELEDSGEVAYAEPNFYRRSTVIPNEGAGNFNRLWGLHNAGQAILGEFGTLDADIDAPEAWDVTTGSPDVTVAVVDTGIDSTHPDLAANIVPGWDFVEDDNTPSDLNGHGTHVAGTIGARGNNGIGVAGVGWSTKLMPLRVLDANGSGYVADVVDAYGYAADQGVEVVNASLGGSYNSEAEKEAIDAAPNTLFVVAAGNGGDDGIGDNNDFAPPPPGSPTPTYPCNYTSANLVCVAASDPDDGRASFSNYGATSVDLAAPGVAVRSTLPGNSYDYWYGTSMATPHVAGAAALLLADQPTLSVANVKAALLGGADAKTAFAGKTRSGGRLNVARALGIAVPSPNPAPSPAANPAPVVGDDVLGSPDLTAPLLTLAAKSRQRLQSTLRRGIRVRLGCSERCEVSAKVVLDKRSARRLHIARSSRSRTVGGLTRSFSRAGKASVRLKLKRSSRRKLRRAKRVRLKLKVSAVDAAGNRRVKSRSILLVR